MQLTSKRVFVPYVMCTMLCPPCSFALLLGRVILITMFSLSYSIKLHKQADISDNGIGVAPFQLTLHPPRIMMLPIDDFYDVHINCSTYHREHIHSFIDSTSRYGAVNSTFQDTTVDFTTESINQYRYVARITSRNAMTALPVESDHVVKPLLYSNRTDQIYVPIYIDGENTFAVYGQHVGHVSFLIQIYEHSDMLSLEEQLELEEELEEGREVEHDTVAILEYRVSVVRDVRLVDIVFECVIAVVATLNAFSMGLSTDWPSLRHHIKHPAALIIGLLCQFVIMPVVSIICYVK